MLKMYFERVQNFNSRAHVERDAHELAGKAAADNFNSRAHVERDNCA